MKLMPGGELTGHLTALPLLAKCKSYMSRVCACAVSISVQPFFHSTREHQENVKSSAHDPRPASVHEQLAAADCCKGIMQESVPETTQIPNVDNFC